MLIYAGLPFVASMICHCELYELRPPARSLPSFYLMVAVGGALGGIFVNLVAPFVFPSGFWELQWAVVACGVLLTVVTFRERPASRRRQRKAAGRSVAQGRRLRPDILASGALLLLLSGLVVALMAAFASSTLAVRRGFYGVLRVWEIHTEEPALRAYQLTHGRTVHGFQFEAPELREVPTTYYAETSGVGLALLNHPARPASLRIGGLGLGVGVIAHYAQPGDVFRFYEINPDMIRFAEGEGGYFSFVSDSKAVTQVVAGDAGLSLENELSTPGPQGFDVLGLDAFSGDAVPLHLLTREAFEVYLQHLAPDVCWLSTFNRYFDLSLRWSTPAEAFGLQAMRRDRGDGAELRLDLDAGP
jgi:hypothetical protein